MNKQQRVGAGADAGQFPQRLRHQTRMQADVGIAHFTVQFRLWNQRRDGVDDHQIQLPGGDEGVGDFQRLLAMVRLRHQQVVDVNAQLARVAGVERMFGVDEGGEPTILLRFGDHLQRDGCLAGRLRAEDFDDPSAREAAHAEG